jgi:hypothetical protein
MAEVYDFTKYKTDQEIEMYISSTSEDEYACFGCPECENPTFLVLLTREVLCSECFAEMGSQE